MRKKLNNWKESLNQFGKRVLVQSALSTLLVYIMQAYAIPIGTCKETDKICRDFLWGDSEDNRKVHLVSWDEVCQPRDKGGLGLRKAKDNNLPLLGKLAYHMIIAPSKFWVQVMRNKYLKLLIYFRLIWT